MAEANPQTSSSKPTKIFNDSVHGHIELPPLVIRIIDTPQFQRLRYIAQMSGKYYVFPGASHNRFEHSIGVAYLAGCLVKELQKRQPELKIDERDVLCVQIAGLCHDLGHGPFSHLFDGRFMPLAGRDFEHEKASVDMLKHLIESNGLKKEMEDHGLILPEDLTFIEEMMVGCRTGNEEIEWRCRGRPREKGFLYEIVANKMNSIDVDKMDYFARDCHHLGMQNNFDYKRFLAFARVCNTPDGKHICIRDKEVWNMYDLFYTRYCLHYRAYQHKVGNAVEIMITDALLAADQRVEIKGSDGNSYSISSSVNDMVAYTKLTDDIFQEILHSSGDNMKAARDILNKLQRRELYAFVGQTKPKVQIDITMKDCRKVEAELAQFKRKEFTEKDFRVDIISINYGNKDKNPISKLWFYRKTKQEDGIPIPEDQVSLMIPRNFQEQFIRVYCTKTEKKILKAAENCLKMWCRKKGYEMSEC